MNAVYNMDYEALIENLLSMEPKLRYGGHTGIADDYKRAANALESLLKQLELAHAERDAVTKRLIELEDE